MKKNKAFTLAETMIVLVILGVVAAITIPALIRRHVESSNRTKIRKAMTVYDTAINKMVVENGIKNNDALINEFNADKNNNSCAKSRAYFKSAQDGANDCTFRASDGVWWNISDINHPIISFNEDDLTAEKASGETNEAFYLRSWFDANGSLRVDDLTAIENYAQASESDKENLVKLYDFINGKTKTSNNEVVNFKEKFKDPCTCSFESMLMSMNTMSSSDCKSCSTGEVEYGGNTYSAVYDENGVIRYYSQYDIYDNELLIETVNNEFGKEINRKFSKNNEFLFEYKYKYNESGNLDEMIEYDANGKIGVIDKTNSWYESGKKKTTTSTYYDENNKIKEITEFLCEEKGGCHSTNHICDSVESCKDYN